MVGPYDMLLSVNRTRNEDMDTETFENETDMLWAFLAVCPFENSEECHTTLDMVQTDIRNFYFIDS